MLPRHVVAIAMLSLAAHAGAQHPVARPRLTIAAPAEKPVALTRVHIEAEIAGSLAQTSVQFAFFNPNARVLEGELVFPLADGQAITGLAMDVDGRLRAAVPVEKARARMVFEDVTRQQIDPALLESTVGNNYRLRVYPIMAGREKRVVIRYAQTLEAPRGARIYRVSLEHGDRMTPSLRIVVRGSDAAPRVVGPAVHTAFVRVDGGWQIDLAPAAVAGRRFLDVAVPTNGAAGVVTGKHQGRTYFHVELPAAASGVPRALPRRVGLVWDSSGSGEARDHARELALLDRYFRALRDGQVVLVRLRERAEAAESYEVRDGDWSALRRALEATVYDGATDLAAFAPVAGVDEYLLVSDGLATFGDAPFSSGGARIHAITSSARHDAQRLRHIAHSSGGRFVDVATMRPGEAAAALLRDESRILDVSGVGVSDLVLASPFVDRGRLSIAGVLDARHGTLRIRIGRDAATARTIEVPVDAGHAESALAPAAWAQLRIASLDGEPVANRRERLDLGKRFGIVTRETSLIVLDRVDDYVRHDIVPPAELVAEFQRLRAVQAERKQRDLATQLERVVAMLREKEAWWQRDFPKTDRPLAIAADRQRAQVAQERRAERSDVPASAPVPASPPGVGRLLASAAGAARAAKTEAGSNAESDAIVVQLKRWTPDAPYIAKLREAQNESLYEAYLAEKPRYAQSTAFYLDAADELFERRQHALALRVLGNLAELDLANRHVLRILAYRLMQAGEARLALPVLRQVLELAPDEPQSFRDLGLAYAADGQCQRAVDTLHEVVRTPWHGRFPEVELIALAELNATLASCGSRVDTSAIDGRLLKNLPVDLRVVLSWDADNTDIDLWVTDPNGERAYYGRPLTWQGGRMSRDFTGGYGPEEFSLRVAKPGRYRVEAHFFGHRQQIVAGATTLQVRFQTRFGTPSMTERAVTLRLQGQGGQVAVGEFDVAAP